jgi:hypothetical protein
MPSRGEATKRPSFIQPDHVVAGGDSVDLSSDPVFAKAIEILEAPTAQEEPTRDAEETSG